MYEMCQTPPPPRQTAADDGALINHHISLLPAAWQNLCCSPPSPNGHGSLRHSDEYIIHGNPRAGHVRVPSAHVWVLGRLGS
nr:hypothetical protein CFP56_56073 [Quercus suber]